MTPEEEDPLLAAIRELLALRRALAASLIAAEPTTRESDSTRWPRVGQVHLDSHEGAWTFTRHGLGFLFRKGSEGPLVDIDIWPGHDHAFDAWSLARHLGSIRWRRRDTATSLPDWTRRALDDLSERGRLLLVSPGLFRLDR
jgi:hypothetical protein